MKWMSLSLAFLMCVWFCGCGALEDDGVHLAFCLKDGAKQLSESGDTELTVPFEPLAGTNQIYTVQFCKDSAVLVWSGQGGSSTYHLNYVRVPTGFYLSKTNEAVWVTLRKVDGHIDVVNVR